MGKERKQKTSNPEGRASVAPSLDLIEAYTEEYFEVIKGVHFSNVVLIKLIPAIGKGMKCRENGAAKWSTPMGEFRYDIEGIKK